MSIEDDFKLQQTDKACPFLLSEGHEARCYVDAALNLDIEALAALVADTKKYKYVSVPASKGVTALHVLSHWGVNREALMLASIEDCNVGIKDVFGRTAADCARQNGHFHLAKRLDEIASSRSSRNPNIRLCIVNPSI